MAIGIVTGILVTASLIDAVKNLYDLTFVIDDDPAKEKKLRYTTSSYNKSLKTRRYFLTIEGNRIVEIEPLE